VPRHHQKFISKTGKLFVRLGYRFQYVFADVWSTASHEREWPCWRRQRGIYVHGYILHIHVSVTFFSCPLSLSFWCQMHVLLFRGYPFSYFFVYVCLFAFSRTVLDVMCIYRVVWHAASMRVSLTSWIWSLQIMVLINYPFIRDFLVRLSSWESSW